MAPTTGISTLIVIIVNTNTNYVIICFNIDINIICHIRISYAVKLKVFANLLLPAELLRRQESPLAVVSVSLLLVRSNNL